MASACRLPQLQPLLSPHCDRGVKQRVLAAIHRGPIQLPHEQPSQLYWPHSFVQVVNSMTVQRDTSHSRSPALTQLYIGRSWNGLRASRTDGPCSHPPLTSQSSIYFSLCLLTVRWLSAMTPAVEHDQASQPTT